MDAPPVTALVVDDEELARSLISTLVKRDPGLRLLGEAADGGAALERIAGDKPDLVFLDVKMPVMDGLQVVERLLQAEYLPYLVFVTAHDDYAIRAFELNVLDYLVKPIEKDRFHAAVQRAKNAIRNNEMLTLTRRLVALGREPPAAPRGADELVVRKGERIVQLLSDDIVWLEAANQYVHVHTATDTYTLSESLTCYLRKLRDSRIVRVHRSAAVNAAAIRSVSRQRNGTHVLELSNGQDVVVARSRASLLPSLLRHARLARDNA